MSAAVDCSHLDLGWDGVDPAELHGPAARRCEPPAPEQSGVRALPPVPDELGECACCGRTARVVVVLGQPACPPCGARAIEAWRARRLPPRRAEIEYALRRVVRACLSRTLTGMPSDSWATEAPTRSLRAGDGGAE